MKNLTIFTEAGSTCGMGHLSRSLALAEEFYCKGFAVTIFIESDISPDVPEKFSAILCSWRKGEGEGWTEEVIKNSSVVVIDALAVDEKLVEKLVSLNEHLILFEEFARKNKLQRGVVVDSTILAEEHPAFTQKNPGVSYLLGARYAVLREAFRREASQKIAAEIGSIFIGFGGADIRNLTPMVLQLLCEKYPALNKHVVIGVAADQKSIEQQGDDKTKFYYGLNQGEMAACMSRCDLALTAGGQMLYEFARLGVPALCITVVDNAEEDALGWAKVGSALHLGWYDQVNLEGRILSAIEAVYAQETRQLMHDLGLKNSASETGLAVVTAAMEIFQLQ